ncbi:MAG: lipopolysaccharide heptosyltransferase II [Alphaproteobacteria bacterium]|nr:lipopolysaccharide heptosyltransferase II [Alphaproteobacteria bacterium]
MTAAATLVIGPAWIGDMVLAHSLFQVLKARDPGAALHVAAPPWTLPLAAFMPEVDRAVALPFAHGEVKLWRRLAIGRGMAGRYDRAILLPNSFKSALVPFFARARRRIGYAGEGRSVLLTDARRLDKAALPRTVDRFVALGLAPGEPVIDPPQPRLSVAPARVDDALAALGLARPDRPMLALCPGAEYGPAKRWPPAYFADVARRQRARGRVVWLFGGAADRESAAAVAAAAADCVDLTGRTSLDQAVALLSLAGAVVTNDSGLMHVAAALGRKVVAVFGSSSPRMTPPLAPDATALWLALECSPCYQRRCPLGHLDCLGKLRPDHVIAALEEA